MASLATLKKDALMYLIGMMAGLFVFGEIAPSLQGFMQSGFVDDSITLPEFIGLSPWIIGGVIIIIALCGFVGAEWLEKRHRNSI